MERSVRYVSALVAGTLAFVVGTSTAHALDKAQIACQDAIGKEGLKFTKSLLKLHQKCRDAELKAAGSCGAPATEDVDKLKAKLESGLAKKCTFTITDANLEAIGFPGTCLDVTPLTKFSGDDLYQCIRDTHSDGVAALLALQYDSTLVSPLPSAELACQKEVAKNGAKLVASVLKAVQKCRSGINKGKILNVLPAQCQVSDIKTSDAVAKAVASAQAKIEAKCNTIPLVTALKICTPDQGTPALAATCITDTHLDIADNPNLGHTATLIDYEYATAASCGDNVVNRPNEECDGADDGNCDGLCGSATGFFACLCQDIKRERVIEHANADLDNGWTGLSHDSGIIEGGGYVTELHDCDNLVDFDCNVGPTCSLPPHSSCANPAGPPYTTGNSICANLGQGTCRRTRAGTTGPHCELDFDQECDTNVQCPGFRDRCIKVPHGMPLPLSSNGISVCVQNTFTEDVVGTKNLLTGASSVRLRQQSVTRLGSIAQPCPVCGGFCAGPPDEAAPSARPRCDEDADCPGSFCVTDFVCSFGVNVDKACRPDPPFGGSSPIFGTTSQDCPRTGADIGQLDILFNPASTAIVTQQASVSCNAAGFGGKVCFQGANDGKDCTLPGDCPGGVCINQCYCPNNAASAQKPNACNAACKGGAFDAQPCIDDSECDPPNGFCHEADCRHNLADTASAQEGSCTAGPAAGTCSLTPYQGCGEDADCASPNCSFCQPAETCVIQPQSCFVNSERFRVGTAGTPDLVSAALFCIPLSAAPSVNATAGLPGPGAITQPSTTMEVGF